MSPRVLITPQNTENPYLTLLGDAVRNHGESVGFFNFHVTKSQSLNIALAFPRLAWARCRGARTLNVHWVYMFHLAWATTVPVLRHLSRWLFLSWLAWAKLWGFSVLYTWHDLVPLNAVFDDDHRSRQQMVRFLDGVITITPAAKEAIVEQFAVSPDAISVIPEGAPVVVHQRLREEARAALGLQPGDIAIGSYGHIDPYKGVDHTAQVLEELASRHHFALRILGEAREPRLAHTLAESISRLKADGHDARWDNRRFTDDELADFLIGMDIIVVAFRYITNSATMRMACAYGKTVIIPDLPALVDTPRGAAVWYDASSPTGLRDAIANVLETWPQGRDARAVAAQDWANAWSWDAVGAATADAYRRAR
jgi:glycosyltransferase involved in cell wall biosynthesis